MFYQHKNPSKITTKDRTLIGMLSAVDQGVHVHDFGEIWAREMAEIRPDEIYFFVELAPANV
jgi:hypothetical protein